MIVNPGECTIRVVFVKLESQHFNFIDNYIEHLNIAFRNGIS
jgi:hypothetical protein